MNIAIVTTWFSAGGGYVSKAYREVLEKEHTVYIYARGGQQMKGNPIWDDEHVTWAPWHYNGIKTSHLLKWVKNKKIDIVFFNEQRYWKPVITLKKAGFKIGSYIDYYTQQTVPAFEIYDFLICNTKRHYSVFKWHRGAYYIPWGTDVDKFKPTKNKTSRVPTFIISAGWQGSKKLDRRGTLLAIKAFSKVKGNCKLKLFSQVKFMECLSEWKELIKDDLRIEFIYGTFDPFPFKEGDVYLYPSRLDGIGLTLPEALSSGLAAITTDNPPMNEFVEEGVNGSLVTVDKYLGRADGYYWAESICNLESLTTKMQQYVYDKNLLSDHKNNAVKYARKYLDWKNNSKNLSSLFSKIAKNDQTYLVENNLESIALNLDKISSPSLLFKLKSLIYSFIQIIVKSK